MHFLARRAVVWFFHKRAPERVPYLSQRSGTIYLPRAEHSTRPGGVSRSRTEPLAPRAKGPAAPSTLAAKPRQPSGIQESTAQVPIPTAPKGLVHKRPLPPLTRSPSPIDGGGKCEGKKSSGQAAAFFSLSVFQCSHDFVDVFYVIFIAPFIHFVHDAFHGCGIGQVGGAYLHGAGAGHHEFDGVFAGHDAA